VRKKKILVAGIIIAVLLVGLYGLVGFATGVEPVEPERIAWLENTLIMHRGFHDNNQSLPENSLAAFAAAIEGGYIIELDVSMTKDKQLVVFHDKKLKRVFGVDKYLSEVTYEELSQYRLFDTEERVPLFSEVLDFVDGRVPLLIEIKNEGTVGEMERLVYLELQDYEGPYAIQSFNPFTLKWFRENAPEVLRGQLSGSFIVSDYEVEYAGTTRLPWYKKFLLKNMLLNFASRPNFISYEVTNVSPSTLKKLQRFEVPVLGWTVREPSVYEKAKDLVDNLVVEASAL